MDTTLVTLSSLLFQTVSGELLEPVNSLFPQVSSFVSKNILIYQTSQVEILIIDLEKANGTARELQKRTEQLERINIEIKSRLEETVQLYEQTQRDLRVKVTEIQRISHELDKTREQKDALGRENKKLGGKFIFKVLVSSFQWNS